MSTSKPKASVTRSGKALRGQAGPSDRLIAESDTGSPAVRGNSEQEPEALEKASGNDLQRETEVVSARGRDDQREINNSRGEAHPEAEASDAAAVRRARRSISVDSLTLGRLATRGTIVNSPILHDARQVVLETRGMVSTLMSRLNDIEKVLSIQESNTITEYRGETQTPEIEIASKGKGIDPRNWANSGIPEEELNPEVQHALQEQVKNARFTYKGVTPDNEEINFQEEDQDEYDHLKELERQYLTAKGKYLQRNMERVTSEPVRNERISSTPMSQDVEELINQAAKQRTYEKKADAIRPSNQLPPESLLGQFFHKPKVHKSENPLSAHPIGPLDTLGNNTTVTRYKPLPPTAPDKYNGEADFMKFYKYITQCERFCEEAGLPHKDQVVKCADYLAGKAYKFYSTMVSITVHQWDRQKFFTELYNYCFPPDYRLRQRKKLENFSQGNMTVAEYAAELMILFRIIGKSTSGQRVDRLWNGLRPELQSALWKEGLDYERNTWDEVIQVATRYEIAEQIEASQRQAQKNTKTYEPSQHQQNQILAHSKY